MTLASGTSYPDDPKCLIVLCDLQYPNIEERLSRERAGWRGFAGMEKFYPRRAAPIIRQGGALELAK